jgi:hypothetical protein
LQLAVTDTADELRIKEQERQAAHQWTGRAVTWRSLLLGTALVPLNAYWVVQMEVIRYSTHPTTISLFFNVIFIILVLAILNLLVARIRPRWALTQAELMAVYMMLALGSALCGHDMVQVLTPTLAWPFRFADSSNRWQELFFQYLPKWLMVSDPKVYTGYFQGNDTFYRVQYILGWAIPVLMWSLFLCVLLFVMLCINVLLRKQWTHRERLTYPVIAVPLVITEGVEQGRVPSVLRNRLFWFAFLLAGTADTLNILHLWFPSVPRILSPGMGDLSYFDLGPLVTQKPWNAIGWTPLSWYPFMIGFGMLLPVDFLFSCWFFYIVWKMERVLSVAMAWDRDPRFPYENNQCFGAYLMFFLFSIWLSRNYLREVLRRAVGLPSAVDDSDEPIRYRWAVLGILAGMAFLVYFGYLLGMSWGLGIAFFAIYFVLAIAITRMRAEFGTPVHDLHFTGPDSILPEVFGTRQFSHSDLTAMSLLYTMNRAYRSHPMPHQLEAFKLAEQTRSNLRGWYWGMIFAGVIGSLAAFWAMLHLNYDYGAVSKSRISFGGESYTRLSTWLQMPTDANITATLAIGVGLLISFFLQFMRTRFTWWPFHPLGFAVSGSWEMNLVWMPLFIAWLVKVVLLRYGGLRLYRRSLPFFFGLILGQFVVGSIANIVGILYDVPTYQFWQ